MNVEMMEIKDIKPFERNAKKHDEKQIKNVMQSIKNYGIVQPKKEFTIRPCEYGEWAKFSKYHYLSNELTKSARCFGLYDNDNIIGFCGVLHQPHGKNKKLKRCSRLVILPDYQGIGLGTKFLNEIAKYYSNMGYDFTIVTSAKNMIMALRKSSKWTMIRYSVNRCSSNKNAIDNNRSSMRNNCKTASFMYKKGN